MEMVGDLKNRAVWSADNLGIIKSISWDDDQRIDHHSVGRNFLYPLPPLQIGRPRGQAALWRAAAKRLNSDVALSPHHEQRRE